MPIVPINTKKNAIKEPPRREWEFKARVRIQGVGDGNKKPNDDGEEVRS